MTAAMAFGHSVKLWSAEVSRQSSIGPQAQLAAHVADSATQFFTLQAVHAAPPPAPSVGSEPSQAMDVPASGEVSPASDKDSPASDDPGEPADDELQPCAVTIVTAKPRTNQAPNLIASILRKPRHYATRHRLVTADVRSRHLARSKFAYANPVGQADDVGPAYFS
jgi:hypothetical protein